MLAPEFSLSSSTMDELSHGSLIIETESDKAGSLATIHTAFLVAEGSGTEFLEHSQGVLLNEVRAASIEDKEVTTGNTERSAAITVQKLYRSYRTRRNLADCAVMAKNFGWWNVVEGALLRQNSETFYAFEKHDTAAARWSRLRRKAAKVGKGLLKDEKARKLALQHWLEAIDARHRYGHNLHFYYDVWQQSRTREPFFYWLDVGEGRDLELPACSRSKLQKEQIKYLGPKERAHYEVVIEDGKLIYKKSKEFVNTPKGDKWIFVMSTSGKLYVAQKEKGRFQHSSFLAGGATTAAGRLLVEDGMLRLMEAHSGHYHPTEDNFKELMNVLTNLGADLRMAKVQCVSDDMLNSHDDKLLKCESGINNDPESVEVVTEQSRTTLLNSRGLHDFEEVMPMNYSAEEVDVSCQNLGNGHDPIDSCVSRASEDAKHVLSRIEGLHIEMLGQVGPNNDVVTLINEGTSGSKNSVSTVTESKQTILSSSQALSKGVEVALLQQGQDKNIRLLRWSSGVGPRISSLSEIPREMLMKAWQGLDKPSSAVSTSDGELRT